MKLKFGTFLIYSLGIILIGIALIKSYSYFNKTPGMIKALPGLENNNGKRLTNQSCPDIHVICTMPLLTKQALNTTRYNFSTVEKIQERMSEFMAGLQRTLNHKCVYRVHLLYNQSALVDYVKANLKKSVKKLVFNYVPDPRLHTAYFDFAFDNLQDKIVMYTPIDVYPGDGFELINKDVMVENKLMYVLTRHGKQEKKCDMQKEASSNSCDDGRYMGSHDSYIFVPIGKFPADVKKELTVTSIDYGVENMSIWAFRNLGHYKVTNPCKVLKVYHLHCTGLRDGRRKRINTGNNTGMARPTDQLN
ncbi:uncharacterized protein LOC126824171 [Patella vulgata]|uniref:uncharacterized protein LOC126824171 n=1 Tax=Patella vulgata TaxID=6465 RepID=UPI00218034F1|nr:uncharacterized protein LOC126824171 [Patella vulgata]XP_050409312.1 uncharacterized protein LOC126824171 [Patella vulgata]